MVAGYLTQATRDMLDDGHGPTPIYPHPEGYGWFIWVPEAEDIPNLEDCPADLMACILYARRHGADYMLIDRDGPDDCDGLTWYEDDEPIMSTSTVEEPAAPHSEPG